MATLQLDEVSPDFEQIVAQLILYLQSQNDAWDDIIPTGFGRTVLDAIGAVGALNQGAIFQAARNAFLDSATFPSAIYAISRTLGVHIQRRIPAYVEVALDNPTRRFVRIPAYTSFSVNGRPFFNRTDILYNDGEAQKTVTLHAGEVVKQDVVSPGGNFQRIYIGPRDFSLSDEDLFCYVNGDVRRRYDRSTEGLYQLGEGEFKFYENTTSDGQVEVLFGNDAYGRAPKTGEVLNFVYVLTNGALDNFAQKNEKVTVDGFNLSGITTSYIAGGSDRKDAEFYRLFAPSLYSSKRGAVTRSHYRAICNTLGGVIDSYFAGQAETQPDNPRRINTIEATILTEGALTDSQFNNIIEQLQAKSQWGMQFIRVDADSVNADVEVEVYCRPNSDLTSIKTEIERALTNLFALKPGSLGFSVFQSYISERVNSVNDAVEYARIIKPNDILIPPTSYVRLNSLLVKMFYTNQRKAN